eukprot:s952_g12.t1
MSQMRKEIRSFLQSGVYERRMLELRDTAQIALDWVEPPSGTACPDGPVCILLHGAIQASVSATMKELSVVVWVLENLNAVAQELDQTVKDMGLAEFGRKELTLAEHEMPGLMAARKEFGPSQPFKGMNINGSLHMTIQTGVLIETLAALGAKVRWCSCNIFSTQDHAAAAIAKAGTSTVFAWKGETLPEYWWCTEQMMTVPGADGCDQLVDDGGDATLLIHKGKEFEEKFAKDGSLPDPSSTTNAEFKCILQLLRDSIQVDKTKYTRMAAKCKGVSEETLRVLGAGCRDFGAICESAEVLGLRGSPHFWVLALEGMVPNQETTTGVHRLREMAAKGELLFPAINVNDCRFFGFALVILDCVTKSKFDNVYGCRPSLPDSIMRAPDVMIGGKRALGAGYGDGGQGCRFALRLPRAEGVSLSNHPPCAGSAHGESAALAHIAVDRFVFPDGHGVIVLASGRLVNLGCATGHPSFVMSCSFTNQVLAQLDILENCTKAKNYKNDVYLLPKKLDEKVAALHLPSLGASMTKLSKEQADYIGDCVTKSKFDNVYGCRHSLPDSIMRATDVMIGGKRALVAGYGDVGKGCAFAMRGAGARVLITEIDPVLGAGCRDFGAICESAEVLGLRGCPHFWVLALAGMVPNQETTTGVHRLREMAAKGELLFPAINVNDCALLL